VARAAALFADLKGSTELMEDLDPEEARAIVDPALRIMVFASRRSRRILRARSRASARRQAFAYLPSSLFVVSLLGHCRTARGGCMTHAGASEPVLGTERYYGLPMLLSRACFPAI
jgi:hypothetical protein